MDIIGQLWEYYCVRLGARRERDKGEVSATTIVLAAALIALALSVGVIISDKVRNKANSLDLG